METQEYSQLIQGYSLDELLGVKARVDKVENPDRYELILAEIDKRKAGIAPINKDGKELIQEERSPYAGFWKRFGAYWLDFIILVPLMYFTIWGSDQSRLFFLYYLVPGIIFGVWYHAYLVKRYGGTPGKLLLKIKIIKFDGTPAGYREALLRYSVMFVFAVVMSSAQLFVTLNMSDELYYSFEWMERTKFINENMPGWYSTVTILLNVWIWSEFIVMLTNRRRRALHDYIAGTVVVHADSEGLLSNNAINPEQPPSSDAS